MIYQEPIQRNEYTATGFRGLAKGTAFGSIDSFADTLNMSGADYPAVRVRDQRELIHSYGTANGSHVIIADGGDGMVHITGKKVYYHQTQIATLATDVGVGEQAVLIGGKLLLVNMGVVITLPGGTVTSVAQTNTVNVTATPCDIDGNAGEANVSTYAKISGTGVATNLNQGDVIAIESSNALDAITDGDYQIIKRISANAIVVIAALTVSSVSASSVKFKRNYPNIAYACECGNRVWGCANTGDRKGQIFCSALGDPLNWNTFQGLSTDSWVSAVGTPGGFTWVCAFQSMPMFFKENEIIKVYGSVPSEYQTVITQAPGVEKGYNGVTRCASVSMDGTLYYRSGEGIMAYDGATPVKIDAALGSGNYTRARFGAGHGKLYVSMYPLETGQNWDNWQTRFNGGSIKPELLVYDTRNGTWYKEDDLKVERFLTSSYGDLYVLEHFIDANNHDQFELWAIDVNEAHGGSGYPTFDEHEISYWVDYSSVWFKLDTGRIEMEKLYRKHAAKLKLRFEYYSQVREDPPPLEISAAFDEGDWQVLKTVDSKGNLMMETVTLIPTRCDYMRLRIGGCGYLKLHEIAFVDENGSEL